MAPLSSSSSYHTPFQIHPSKTLIPKSPSNLIHPPSSRKLASPAVFPLPLVVNNSTARRSIKPYVVPRDFSSPSTRNSKEESRVNGATTRGAESRSISSLTSLLTAYKQAILSTDKESVKEIESKMAIIEDKEEELFQKVSELTAEINSGKERYVRLQADFDNFRKRSEKERLNVISDAQGEVIESLLPMVDSFERAKQHLKPETEIEKKIDTSYQGIYKQFVEILRSLKVSAVPAVGKPFNPSLHEAIAREESQEYKEGIIIQEFRRGFIFGGRLLRPATVKVSAGPGRKEASSGAENATGDPAGVDEQPQWSTHSTKNLI